MKKNQIKQHVKILICSILIIGASSCAPHKAVLSTPKKLGQVVKSQRGKLISHEYINTVKADSVVAFLPEIDMYEGDLRVLPKYDIDLYRIVYTSVQMGKLENLSGYIVVPKRPGSMPVMQYQHGTMLPFPAPLGEGNNDISSLYDGKRAKAQFSHFEARLFGNFIGSYGYLIAMPDYGGYGASTHLEHYYSVNDIVDEQNVDMVFATREFCKKLNININDKLFLSGWSEGGGATMATQKLIDTEYKDEIKLTATAPMGGFYNARPRTKTLLGLVPFVPEDDELDLDVLLWGLYSINKYYDPPLADDKIFKYTINNPVDIWENKPKGRLSKALRWMHGKNKKILLDKIDQNSLHKGWKPIAPIYIHHGKEDDIVIFKSNADVAAESLNEAGGNVTLRAYEGHDHYTFVFKYILTMLEDFEKYQQ